MANSADKTTSASGSANRLVTAQYESRSNLPEYKRWQNAMRPEDNGYSDGLSDVPSATDQFSSFEARVRDHLNSQLGVVRNQFANDDAQMLSEIAPRTADLLYFRRLVEEKREALRRPVMSSLDRRGGHVAICVATALAATLLAILWLDKGLGTITATLVALLSAVIGSSVAYLCGLVLRQAKRDWQKWLAAAALLLMAGATIFVCANMRTPSFDGGERATFGLFVTFALLGVAAAAFMMHDPDTTYRTLEARYAELNHRVTQLDVARKENRVFHTNVARRHVQLASQMISSYRQANIGARPAGTSLPTLFDSPATLPDIDDAWLTFLEV